MKKRMRSVLAAFLTVMLFAAAYAPAVCAAEAQTEENKAGAETPMVEVPVTITLSGTEPDAPESFHIRLQAENAESPMPEGSQEKSFLLELAGANTGAFPAISYPKVGVYHYTISQDAGSNSGCSYDRTVYYLTVYVTNAKDGGLESTTVLYKENESDKLDRAAFHNAYASAQNPGDGGSESEETPVIPAVVSKAEAEPETEPEATADPVQQTDAASNGGQTGDEAMPVVWGALLFAAACAVVVIMMKRKKNEDTEE